MRVLVVTNAWPTEDEPWYGCYVRDQVEDVRALGVEVDVHSFDGRTSRTTYLRAIARVRSVLRHGAYDVVHAHYGLTGAVAVLAGARSRAALLVTFHGSETGYIPWQLRVSRLVGRRCRPIVVDAAAIARLRLDRADVLPCAVDTDAFSPGDRNAARRALGWEADASIALFASGTATRVKRHELFIGAVAVASRSDPSWRGRSIEGLDREQVALAMRASDVMVLTSTAEGSPITVREALASGTPVVSGDVGDVRQVLDGLPGCEVVADDPATLGAAISGPRRLAVDQELLRERALESSRPRIAARLVDLYEDAVRARDV